MIGGNTIASIQIRTGNTFNKLGERETEYITVQNIAGWLDLQSGDSKHTMYNSKIQESTHIFVSDYQVLDASIKAENSRMVVNNEVYEITLIDDPMGLHKHLEIFLKYTGGA